MKKVLQIILLGFATLFFAQKYEAGYFITNDGVKHDATIKNLDWYKNPKDFKYKENTSEEEKTETVANIKEFGITGASKFVRYIGKVNVAAQNLQKLGWEKEPIWKDKTVFLKVLSEGKATLYFLRDEDSENFFVGKNDENIEPLIYVKYFADGSEDNVAKNNLYKTQLMKILNADRNYSKMINNTEYKTSDLTKLFNSYNNVNEAKASNFRKENSVKIHLSARPGVNFSSLSVNSTLPDYSNFNSNFDSKATFRMGLEAEFSLPFNNRSWSIILEPTYQSFKSTGTTAANLKAEVDYSSIEIPLGVRYYFNISQKSRMFIDGSFVVANADMNKKLSLESPFFSTAKNYDLESSSNFIFGVGYNYNNKFSIEARVHTERHVLNYLYFNSAFKTTSLVFGYTIF